MDLLSPILFFLITQLFIPVLGDDSVKGKLLASHSISLEKRYDDKFVNDVFKDNILLNTAYFSGKVTKKENINWNDVKKPFKYRFTLMPNKTFAFHEDVSEKYKDSVSLTTNANFNFDDGFKSDGYLTGDGVCHLASLMYLVAKNAGLEAYAPTNHDFREIPEISKEYGVSIYKMPGNTSGNAMQNLYITNNKENPIVFELSYKDSQLKFSINEEL